MFTSFWKTYGDKIKSLAIGAILAGIGAGATILLDGLSQLDFGDNSVFVAAGLSVLANFIRKLGIPVAVNFVKGSSL